MYTIDIIVRNTAIPISIDKKEADVAEQVYRTATARVGSTDNVARITAQGITAATRTIQRAAQGSPGNGEAVIAGATRQVLDICEQTDRGTGATVGAADRIASVTA